MSLHSRPAGKPVLSVRELTTMSLLAAMMIAGQLCMASLPNIEPVSLIIIACASVYGLKALWPTYVFVLVEGLIYGFSMWYVCYLYIWAMLVFAVILLRNVRGRLPMAALSGVFGLMFGALSEIPFVFLIGIKASAAAWVSGIPFDILHAIGNFVMAFLLLPACVNILSRISGKSADNRGENA